MADFKHDYIPETTNDTPDLLDDMAANGCEPVDSSIVLTAETGAITRFVIKGDKPSNRNGWMQAGDIVTVYGDWKRQGRPFAWSQNGGSRALTRAELEKIDAAIAASKSEKAAKQGAATKRAVERIEAADVASDEHPYLVKKNISGESMFQEGENLLIPMYNSDDELKALQQIQPNGEKRFPSGTPKKGNFWICGQIVDLNGTELQKVEYNGTIYVGEGVATMAAVRRATGACVVAAMDSGNLPVVAEAIRFRFPDNEIVICGDNDEAGRNAVEKATQAVDSDWAFPTIESGNDFADLPDDRAVIFSIYPEVEEQIGIFEASPSIQTLYTVAQEFANHVAEGFIPVSAFMPMFFETAINAGIDSGDVYAGIKAGLGIKSTDNADGSCTIIVPSALLVTVSANDIEWNDDHDDESLEELEVPTSEYFSTAGLPRLWWREELDGMLGLLVKAINDQCPRDQPELALAAAIPIVGALAGRRYQWADGLMTNIYSIGVARTASGKDTGLEVADAVFDASGCNDRQMGDHIASGQGLASALVENPTKFLGVDEFGKFIAKNGNGKASNHEALIGTFLLSLFSGRDFKGSEKANKVEHARQVVSRPALSVYGATTPSTLYSALNSGTSLEGTLNRNLFFFAPEKNPPAREKLAYELPTTVVQYGQRINAGAENHDTFPLGENASFKPNPYTIPVTADAKDVLTTMYAEQDILVNHDDELVNAAYGRVTEIAKKLAMIRAISRHPQAPEVTADDMLWSGRISFSSAQKIAAKCRDHVADNEQQQKVQRLLSVVRDAGKRGIGLSALTRQSRWLKAAERNSILDDLLKEKSVTSDANPTTGRTASRYIFTKHRRKK